MSGPKLVDLRGGAPALTDIPAQLRKLAADLEAGTYTTESVLLVMTQGEDYPRVFNWGAHLRDQDVVFIASQLQIKFTNYRQERGS